VERRGETAPPCVRKRERRRAQASSLRPRHASTPPRDTTIAQKGKAGSAAGKMLRRTPMPPETCAKERAEATARRIDSMPPEERRRVIRYRRVACTTERTEGPGSAMHCAPFLAWPHSRRPPRPAPAAAAAPAGASQRVRRAQRRRPQRRRPETLTASARKEMR